MSDIDMPYLLFAWQDDSPDRSYYLNKETGSVELVQQELLDVDDLTNTIERDHENYLYLPKPDKSELKRDLHDFVAAVSDESLRRILEMTLEASDALSACKSQLAKHGDYLQQWDKFRTRQVQNRVNKWLAANFITIGGNTSGIDLE